MFSTKHYIDLAGGKFNGTSTSDLRSLFRELENSPTKDHIVVHFHGGLVSRELAEAGAERLMTCYTEGGAYPIFFFWRSDLLTILSRDLDKIATEPIFRRLVKRLVQLALSKLKDYVGARSAGPLMLVSEEDLPDDPELLEQFATAREPDGAIAEGVELTSKQIEQAELELETDEIIQKESIAIAEWVAPAVEHPDLADRAGSYRVEPRPTLMSQNVRDELAQAETARGARGVSMFLLVKHGLIILKRVIERFARARDHGIYATVVEEILRELYLDSVGTSVWTLMKNDTHQAFGEDAEVFGGTAFGAELRKWWRPGRRITLVGHSTGAIYIGNLLEHIDPLFDPEMKFDVIFLAPACSFEFLAARLEVFRRRVHHIRVFGLQDELERGYWEVPVLYPASLLYMVSGLFEEPTVDMPIVGMQRYFSNARPYTSQEIRAVVTYLDRKCVWSLADGGPGFRCSAKNHGGFDADQSTRASLTEFLRTAETG